MFKFKKMFTMLTTGSTEEADVEDGDTEDGNYDDTGKAWRKSGDTDDYRVCTSSSREPDTAKSSIGEKPYPIGIAGSHTHRIREPAHMQPHGRLRNTQQTKAADQYKIQSFLGDGDKRCGKRGDDDADYCVRTIGVSAEQQRSP